MIQELGDQLIPVVAITLGCLFMVVWVVMATVDSIYKTKCNSRLKEKLIDRGASAAEIAKIIQIQPSEASTAYVPPVPPVKVVHR